MPDQLPDPAALAFPTLAEIKTTADRLIGKILTTPVWRWQTGVIDDTFGSSTEVWLKLELFQRTGTFKVRAALNSVAALDTTSRRDGVVAVSAGNHAIAVAHAGKLFGVSVKVVMPRHASPVRVAACKDLGAEVLLVTDLRQAFARGAQIEREEQRIMIHPFEGPLVAEATATIGLELMDQVADLHAVIVPIGGGGLCAGIAAAVKQINPACAVYGVEPFGADTMYQSFQSGGTTTLERVDTIADSLAPPYSLAYSFGVCRRFVDDVVRVSDDEMCCAMYYLFRDAKLVTEPAAAAATAALLGPLRLRLQGKHVALIVCGTNIDSARFAELLERGNRLCEMTTTPAWIHPAPAS